MRAERVFYECSPYLHSVVGVATILYPDGSIAMKAFGLLLLAVAMTVLGLRWVYRFDLAREVQASSRSKYSAKHARK